MSRVRCCFAQGVVPPIRYLGEDFPESNRRKGRFLGRSGVGVAILLFICAAVSVSGQQVLTIAPSSGVGPAEIYSGTNYSGIHTNGFTINSSGGTDQVDLQVTNLPPGATVFPINSFVPPSA